MERTGLGAIVLGGKEEGVGMLLPKLLVLDVNVKCGTKGVYQRVFWKCHAEVLLSECCKRCVAGVREHGRRCCVPDVLRQNGELFSTLFRLARMVTSR